MLLLPSNAPFDPKRIGLTDTAGAVDSVTIGKDDLLLADSMSNLVANDSDLSTDDSDSLRSADSDRSGGGSVGWILLCILINLCTGKWHRWQTQRSPEDRQSILYSHRVQKTPRGH